MIYHALFDIFEKATIWNCRLLQIIDGALRVNPLIYIFKENDSTDSW